MVTVAGALLAAGEGVRFGAPQGKLRAPLGGRPLIEWALEAFGAATELAARAVVVGRDDLGDLIGGRWPTLTNERAHDGLATSLATAVEWARGIGADALVVGLGDQPFIAARAWSALAQAAGGADIAVATYGGVRANPVCLHERVFGLIPREGDVGARVLMGRSDLRVVEVPCEGDPLDVDTPSDLALAEARLGDERSWARRR